MRGDGCPVPPVPLPVVGFRDPVRVAHILLASQRLAQQLGIAQPQTEPLTQLLDRHDLVAGRVDLSDLAASHADRRPVLHGELIDRRLTQHRLGEHVGVRLGDLHRHLSQTRIGQVTHDRQDVLAVVHEVHFSSPLDLTYAAILLDCIGFVKRKNFNEINHLQLRGSQGAQSPSHRSYARRFRRS